MPSVEPFNQLPHWPIYVTEDGEFPTIQAAAKSLGTVTLDKDGDGDRYPGATSNSLAMEYGAAFKRGEFSRATMFREIRARPMTPTGPIADLMSHLPGDRIIGPSNPGKCADSLLEAVRCAIDASKRLIVPHSSGADSRLLSAVLARLRDEGVDVGDPVFYVFQPECDESVAILEALGWGDNALPVYAEHGPTDYYAPVVDFELVGAAYSEPRRLWIGQHLAALALREGGYLDGEAYGMSMLMGDMVGAWHLRPDWRSMDVASLGAKYFFDSPHLLPGEDVPFFFPHVSAEFLRVLTTWRITEELVAWKIAMARHIAPEVAELDAFPNSRTWLAPLLARKGFHPWMVLSDEVRKRIGTSFVKSWYCRHFELRWLCPWPRVFPPMYMGDIVTAYIRAAICENLLDAGVEVVA